MDDRIVLHVDMDAFFAACEELRHPEAQGKPLIVGAPPEAGRGRGVVVASNYAARAFGVRSAMPIQEAWRRCPDANYVAPDHRYYFDLSRRIFGALEQDFAAQKVSVDEAYIEATGRATWDTVHAFADGIRARVASISGGLSCSIGVAPNKLVAKIATDQNKPAGVTLVRPTEIQSFLDPLPARRIPGIGPKTTERLAELGIRTVHELRLRPIGELTQQFGVHGEFMHRAAHGRSDSRVETERESSKSMSEEHTFGSDTRDRHHLIRSLRRMVASLEEDLHRHDYWYKNVALKVRYEDFVTHTRQASLPHPTQDTTTVRRVLPQLLDQFLHDPRAVRLIGVRFGALMHGLGQRTLHEYAIARGIPHA